MARHGSLSEQLAALMAYRNRPEGPVEPMGSNWTVVPANDDISVKALSHERDIRMTPSVDEIMRQVATGDVERGPSREITVLKDGAPEKVKLPGPIIRIGNLHFSDGTQTEKAFKRTGGRSVAEVNVAMPVGAMLGCREQAERASGGKGHDGSYRRRSNEYFADSLGVDVPSKVRGKARRNGPGYSRDEMQAMLAEAIANTKSMPAVKRYPAGLPATRDLVSDHFNGMKISATGQAGGAAWEDISGAIVRREIWDAALAEMKGEDIAVLDKAMGADKMADLGGMAPERTAIRRGSKRLKAANDNLSAALRKNAV